MSEVPPKDQQEKQPGPEENGLASRESQGEPTWEMVLTRAGSGELTEPDKPPPPPQSAKYLRWVKALTPVAVLLLYVAYKIAVSWGPESSYQFPVHKEAESLTGVEAAQEESLRMPAEVEEFVAKLEAMRQRRQWHTIKETIAGENRPAVRNHPVVRAWGLLARAHTGERNVDLERDLTVMEATLRPEGKRYGELLHELRIARAEQIVRRSGTENILVLNTGIFHELLGKEVESRYEVTVRLQLARTTEDIADRLMRDSEGYLSTDTVLVAQAREYYQMALRWIVQQDTWPALRAIDPAVQLEVATLVEKLRVANRKIHGPSLPLTGSDSSTWTGRKGDPVHAPPAGGSR